MLLQIVHLVKYWMKCQFTKSRDFTSFLVTSGNKGCFSTIFQSHLHGQTGQFTVWANGKQNSRRCIPKFLTKIFSDGFFPFNFAPRIFQNFRLNGSLFGNSPVSGIFGNFSWQFLYHYCRWFQIFESFGWIGSVYYLGKYYLLSENIQWNERFRLLHPLKFSVQMVSAPTAIRKFSAGTT